MTVVQKTGVTQDLAWLLDDMVGRVAHAERGIVLSADGLLMAASKGLTREEAEHLAAAAAGFQSLARGTGRQFGGGSAVRQTIVEMQTAFLFVTAAGRGACLAVLAHADADVGLIAYEMAMLVSRVGQFLSAEARGPAEDADSVGPRT